VDGDDGGDTEIVGDGPPVEVGVPVDVGVPVEVPVPVGVGLVVPPVPPEEGLVVPPPVPLVEGPPPPPEALTNGEKGSLPLSGNPDGGAVVRGVLVLCGDLGVLPGLGAGLNGELGPDVVVATGVPLPLWNRRK
jgi:hypothetical protein